MPNNAESATIDGMSETDLEPNADSPANSPFAEQLHVPQFGILHLLLWIAATAVLLKLFMWLSCQFAQQLSPVQYWIGQFSQTACAIVIASALVGSGVLLRLRCYRMLRKLQPGHWLLLMATLGFIIEWILPLPFLFVSDRSMAATAVSYLVNVGFYVEIGLSAAAFGYAYFHLRDTPLWKIVIGAKWIGAMAAIALRVFFFVANLLPPALTSPLASGQITGWCSTVWTAAVLVLLLSAAASDLRNRRDRDWVHWLGVAVLAFTCAMEVFQRIYLVFFYHP